MAEIAPVDRVVLNNLLSMFNGDKAFVYQVIDTYVADGVRLIETLQQGVADSQPEAVSRAAHSLKSNSANVGAMPLSQLCKELEELSRQGNLAGASVRAQQIASAFGQVRAALDTIRTEGL